MDRRIAAPNWVVFHGDRTAGYSKTDAKRATHGVSHHAISLFEADQIGPAQRCGSILQSLVRGIRAVLMQNLE
jgi:hypothetical protein